jgi:hypothetical protein
MPVVTVDSSTDAAERLETRRRKMREAQRRYYDKHKRKKPERPEPRPHCPEHIRACKREYYLQHRDAIIARSKQRYQDDKALRQTAACGATHEA